MWHVQSVEHREPTASIATTYENAAAAMGTAWLVSTRTCHIPGARALFRAGFICVIGCVVLSGILGSR